MSSAAAPPNVAVLMCGLPGRMGHSVAEAVVRRWGPDALLPFSPTGPEIEEDSVTVAGKEGAVELLRPDDRDAAWSRVEEAAAGRLIIAADYTHPDAAVANCGWYREKNLPFVMGTTGYDIDAARAAIGPELYAVLAPNMGKPIVLIQAMLDHAASTYPGALAGYDLSIVESHQKGKADTSGTAKALAASLATLNSSDFGLEDIEMVREPPEQAARMGVPEHAIVRNQRSAWPLEPPSSPCPAPVELLWVLMVSVLGVRRGTPTTRTA